MIATQAHRRSFLMGPRNRRRERRSCIASSLILFTIVMLAHPVLIECRDVYGPRGICGEGTESYFRSRIAKSSAEGIDVVIRKLTY